MCGSSHSLLVIFFFFFNDTATTEIYTLPYTTLFRSLGLPGHAAAHDLAMLDASRVQHRSGHLPGGRRGRLGVALRHDVAAVDPDLHADAPVGRVGVDLAVADVGSKRGERDPTLAVPFAPAHLGAAEAARDHDLHALRAGLHRALDRLLHRLLEGDAARQLLADVGRDEVRVELRLADLLDLQLDLALRERADLLAQDLDVLAALADDDARLGRVHGHRDLPEVALDLEAADARVGEPLLHELADRDVLGQERRVLLVVVPLRGPGASHPEAEAVRVDLVSHVSALPVADGDGDVRGALVDRERPTLGARAPALDRRALIGARIEHPELVRGQVVVVLGVRCRALEHPGDVLGGVLGHELEQVRGLLHGATRSEEHTSE